MIPLVLVAGLAIVATAAQAQSSQRRFGEGGNRPPVEVGNCAILRSCPPGAAVDLLKLLSPPRKVGMLRLVVHPANAEVYVDGVYAGHAEEFDGYASRGALGTGRYRVEVRAEGFVPMAFTARIEKAQTTTHRAVLNPRRDSSAR